MVMPTTTPLQQELTRVQKLPILLKKAIEESRRGSVFASGCFAIVKADPKSATATKTDI